MIEYYLHIIYTLPAHSTHLLPDLLEAVQDGHTGDAVDLAERVEADGVKLVLAGHLGILDDGTGRMVHDHHRLVALRERERERESERK